MTALGFQPLLKGRVVLVTGASRGIGRAIAEAFAREGAAVALNARASQALDSAVESLSRSGWVACAVPGDVGDEDAIIRIFRDVDRLLGPLDVLVNNAGGGHGSHDLEQLTTDDLWKVIRVDLVGAILCCREAIRRMRGRGGTIINVSSQAGRSASELAGCHYAAAKAGVLGLTRQLARDYGRESIRVNAIAAGVTLSERVQRKLEERSSEVRARLVSAIPLGRLAEPEDIAEVAVFLATDASRYITGATIDVNGGRFTF